MTTTEGTTSIAQATHTSSRGVRTDSHRARRSARAQYRLAERELSTYTTPAELQELDAMLARTQEQGDTAYAQLIERIRFRAA